MKKIVLTVAALAAIPSISMADDMVGSFGQTENLLGLYGQFVSTPSSVSASIPGASASASGSQTVGGMGVFANGINGQLWFVHLGFNYGFGAPLSGGSGSVVSVLGNASASYHAKTYGHSLQFNARAGKLFQVSPTIAVGPYIAYQYADFYIGYDGLGTVKYGNNGLGGGVEVATNTGGPFDVSAHAGYLAGLSSTATATYQGNSYGAENPPASGIFQLGAKGVYAFSDDFSAFAGVNYDRYHATYSYAPYQLAAAATINEVRGMVGLAYHY
ncbi:hypothetical protein HFU84_02055 [Acidithiobacillus sp. CV18-2]|uniref:Outer membrane protein beta-barrel domain-containing protein n=1 Tax=Igneacidithiobacillus copahuensis TaxID=2724909 RepID=A0AAE2YS25_9PROT|nr:hypothetical protein [Igneacidithiobacillus copahuensis]MBU2754213.1 hypothetical protein [Acidithiobacillus sp. CV18-3]MBU2756048.1 hypothetical protein [Acidithiobacillus sp. BN09-2]MBU2776316.1 hypothetical protein [Acidithiobacillus sp. CV18-2]MBU2795467.1 hypothetical protein [Acidithiobacillus sp. VAN18-2]MBU2799225.1 hypothetical protein [Acidithiobacillus sp. VAN18-4]UTV82243.1 hypothetical protein MQE22_06405 [Acidithiobacillus sp. YTS05]